MELKTTRNKSKSVEEVANSIVSSISEWAARRKEFNGVPLEDLDRSLGSAVKGVRHTKDKLHASWLSLPVGSLSLTLMEVLSIQIN